MENQTLTVKDIEAALEKICKNNPELKPGVSWFYTGMSNSKGEPLYLVDLGTLGCHAYIGGTKTQLEERIELYYKHLLDSI